MISDQANAQLYSQFSKSGGLNNREFLTLACKQNSPAPKLEPKLEYKPDEVVISGKKSYYNDDIEAENKRKKKRKAAFIILGLALAASAAGAIIASRPVKRAQIKEYLSSGKIKNNSLLRTTSNTVSNANNVKDDYFARATEKLKEKVPALGFIDDLCKKYTEFYRRLHHSGSRSRYDKLYNAVKEAAGADFSKLGIEEYDKFYNGANKSIISKLKETRITKNLLDKNIVKKMTNSNIADGIIKDVYSQSLTVAPQGASKELVGAIENLNAEKIKMLQKMRDINAGAAPTDFINQIFIPSAALGVAVATSKTKEEKKSTVVNLGVPIASAIGTTMYCNIQGFSGLYGMVIGLALGKVITETAKLGFKLHNKSVERRQQKTDTIA